MWKALLLLFKENKNSVLHSDEICLESKLTSLKMFQLLYFRELQIAINDTVIKVV